MFLLFRIANNISAWIFRFSCRWFFRRYGAGSKLVFPRGIEGIANIAIGDRVYAAHGCLLAAVPLTGSQTCSLEIGDGTSLGSMNHIYATRRIVIGQNVLTANNVYIADNAHGFANIETPIMYQPVEQRPDVEIGAGTWLGQNACVIGAKVGRNCVVGANAVVTRDIPDFCVVAGAPAIIIRRFDTASNSWRRTEPDGTFKLV